MSRLGLLRLCAQVHEDELERACLHSQEHPSHPRLKCELPARPASFRVHAGKASSDLCFLLFAMEPFLLPTNGEAAWFYSARSHLMAFKPQKSSSQDSFPVIYLFFLWLFKDRKQQPFPIWSKTTGLFLIPFISISFTPRVYGMFPYLHNGLIILSSIGPFLTWWQLCFPASFQVYCKGQKGLRHPENILFMFL